MTLFWCLSIDDDDELLYDDLTVTSRIPDMIDEQTYDEQQWENEQDDWWAVLQQSLYHEQRWWAEKMSNFDVSEMSWW